MRAYYVNANAVKFDSIDIEPTFEECYRLLKCDCINIVERRVGGTVFSIVLDDEGLLKPNRIGGAATDCDELLAGNLLLFGVDEVTHDLRSLTEYEAQTIGENVVVAILQLEDGYSIGPVIAYETR
jgi:hypothetical protein